MPQSAWSKKDERMYEHVKESERDRGSERAEEIAARTVNKHRREEGRTKEQHEQQHGSDGHDQGRSSSGSDGSGLESKKKEELYTQAKNMEIHGRSRMNKSELIDAIRKKNGN